MREKSLGAISSPKDVRDYRAACVSNTDFEFPEKYEVYTCPVKDQGNVGSCVAHSIAEVIEMFNHQQESINTTMSTGYIYGNRLNSTHKESGMVVRDALKAVLEYGTTPYEKFPDNIEVPEAIDKFENSYLDLRSEAYINKISSYYSIKSDDILKYALMSGDKVIFAMPWYQDIRIVDGVLSTTEFEQFKIGLHCMIIYGWNEKGWLIQNSWSERWANEGKCILPYSIKRAETWGIKDSVYHLQLKKDWIEKAKNEVKDLEDKLDKLTFEISCLEDDLFKEDNKATISYLTNKIQSCKEERNRVKEKIVSLQVQINSTRLDLIIIKKPFNSKFGKWIAKIINKILNLFD